MAFAEATTVSALKSRHEIESLVLRYGASRFATAIAPERAQIMFEAKGRLLRFDLTIPSPTEKRFTQHPKYSWQRLTENQTRAKWEQEERRLWRALALVIKAKLESVESGIETFESAFAMNIVMPDGKLFSEHALPAIAEAYESGRAPRLLLTAGEP